jgi:hypothetical protein
MNQNFGDRWPDMATDNIARSVMPNTPPSISEGFEEPLSGA